MKKSALFILFALISVAGFSQITGWNAKVGMNISNYTGDADLNAKIGFKLGGGFEYAFDNTWSLQPSLFLSTKGAKKDGNSINAMYLELPVMAAARFNVADNTNIVVNAGPYLACGIAGKTKIDLGNDTERKYDTFGDDALKRFDAAVVVGGTSFTGGKGNISGVIIGVFILGIINNLLDLMNVSSYPQMMLKGTIIVAAVIFSTIKDKKS